MKDLKWRFILIIFVAVLGIIFILPSIGFSPPKTLENYLSKLSLGLDLQGGMHLILEVDTQKALKNLLDRDIEDIKGILGENGIPYGSLERTGDRVVIDLLNPNDENKFNNILKDRFPSLIGRYNKAGDELKVELEFTDKEKKAIKESIIEQALETIRNRIDQFGVAEPDIHREGEDRIVVQLPGIKDPDRAIALIGKTAILEFKLVDEENSVEKALEGNIPIGDEILYQRRVDRDTGAVSQTPYLLKKRTLMTGDLIKNAMVRIDTNLNEPYVLIEFNDRGANLFEQITAANEKKRLAIILDNNVYSAPVIQEKISGGKAQITGSFTDQEAGDLAIVLKAGALPAPVNILEKIIVGPSLGKDSINKGTKSAVIGGVLVVIFMVVYYNLSGLIANLALILNVLLILSCLSALRATLTLPGIAGIVLTMGMAVDANVLIFERIREELRTGKTIRAAIDAGFSRAFLTILDANITTIIAAIVLFQFGTGPIKGFGVTLTVGLLASMFTAIFVCRAIFDLWTGKRRIKRLSI